MFQCSSCCLQWYLRFHVLKQFFCFGTIVASKDIHMFRWFRWRFGFKTDAWNGATVKSANCCRPAAAVTSHSVTSHFRARTTHIRTSATRCGTTTWRLQVPRHSPAVPGDSRSLAPRTCACATWTTAAAVGAMTSWSMTSSETSTAAGQSLVVVDCRRNL